MAYVWDEDKAASNYRKHNVSFGFALRAFEDVEAIHVRDFNEADGEERWNVTGFAQELLITVTYTLRDEDTRLISARKATREERDAYARDQI